MVIWCAYCQTFQGEREPFDDGNFTHSVCSSCAKLDLDRLDARAADMAPVSLLMSQLWTLSQRGNLADAASFTVQAGALGIRPIDMLMGMVAPLLAKVGRMWSDGDLSAAEEHQVTAFLDGVIRNVRASDVRLQSLLDSASPNFLLVNCEGNYHTLGLRIAELWLADHGLSSRVVVPGIPSGELSRLLGQVPAKRVGISISMPEQLPMLQEMLRQIDALENRPPVFVGGFAVKSGVVRPADLPSTTFVLQLSAAIGELAANG